jgi:hypothetical protein
MCSCEQDRKATVVPYKTGDIVYSKLTGEKLMFLEVAVMPAFDYRLRYNVRDASGNVLEIRPEEIEFRPEVQ